MLLNSDVLQDFIDKIMGDIKYNINIIDPNGFIVASGAKNRIGKFHKVALEAAQKRCRIDVNEVDVKNNGGVLAGVNQPFYYKNVLAGIIGITGKPNEISDIVKIVKSMIELLYEQEILKQKVYSRQNKKFFFVNELLNLTTEEGKAAVMNWGSALGYDMSVRRNIIIVDFIGDEVRQKLFPIEKMMTDLIAKIKNMESHRKNDITCMISYNRIIILKTSSINNFSEEASILREYSSELLQIIEKASVLEFYIAVGSFYDELFDLKESFFEASYVVNQLINQKSERLGHISDYLLGYLLSRLPKGIIPHFFEDSYEMIKNVPEFPETITSLAKCNMQLSKCSKDLFLHRNTVQFRLNKIRELLHINPFFCKADYEFLILLAEYIESVKVRPE